MHTITSRNIPHAYDTLMRMIWTQGHKKIDQRGNETRELKHVFVEITTPDITYPTFGPTSPRYGEDFADGLIDDEIAMKKGSLFDYGYGDRIRASGALTHAIALLQNDPNTRRVAVPIYMPFDVQNACSGSEVPCATQFYLDIENGELNMVLMMRSNDIPGAFPGDACGFRKLQEHIANKVGVGMGKYFHYANSAHIIINNDGDFMKQFIKTPVNWY